MHPIWVHPNNDLIYTMKAKPFVKWVGGKTQLIEQLEALLPADFDTWENVTYIEPFVGGGAMLFYMLQTHSNIKSAIIMVFSLEITCFHPFYLPFQNHKAFFWVVHRSFG